MQLRPREERDRDRPGVLGEAGRKGAGYQQVEVAVEGRREVSATEEAVPQQGGSLLVSVVA